MHHVFKHQVVQQHLLIIPLRFIFCCRAGTRREERNLGHDDVIDFVSRFDTVALSKNDQNVSMREAPLLELDHCKMSDCSPEGVPLFYVVEHLVELKAKDSRDDIWTICGGHTGG